MYSKQYKATILVVSSNVHVDVARLVTYVVTCTWYMSSYKPIVLDLQQGALFSQRGRFQSLSN